MATALLAAGGQAWKRTCPGQRDARPSTWPGSTDKHPVAGGAGHRGWEAGSGPGGPGEGGWADRRGWAECVGAAAALPGTGQGTEQGAQGLTSVLSAWQGWGWGCRQTGWQNKALPTPSFSQPLNKTTKCVSKPFLAISEH